MITNAHLMQRLSQEDPAADATETLGRIVQEMVPQPTLAHVEDGAPGETREIAPPEPTEAGVVPAFIAKTLCFTLPLLRKFVKVSGQVSDAIDILIAFVCSQT